MMTTSHLLMALTLWLVIGGATPSPPQVVFRASADLVLVPVAVTRGGRPVADLDVQDFHLEDEGERRDVQLLPASSVPIDLTLVLSAVPTASWSRFRHNASEGLSGIQKLLRAGDRLRVLNIDTTTREVVPLGAPTPIVIPPGGQLVSGTALHDGLLYILTQPVAAGRAQLTVVVTAGRDTWSTLDADVLVPVAERSSATLYVGLVSVDEGSVGLPELAAQRAQTLHALTQAAEITGGRVHRDSNITSMVERVLTAYRTSYVLVFSPNGSEQGGWRSIRVRIGRPGRFEVAARRGYYTTRR